MIKREELVIGGAVFRERVVRIIEPRLNATCDIEGSCNPEGAEGIKSVSIAQDRGFQALRFYARRKTVSLDRVGGRFNPLLWPTETTKHAARHIGREAGRKSTAGGVLLHGDTIVKQRRDGKKLRISLGFFRNNLQDSAPYAQQMRPVV